MRLIVLLLALLTIAYLFAVVKIRSSALSARLNPTESSIWLNAWQSVGTMSAVFIGAAAALLSVYAVHVTQEQRDVASRQADLMQQQLEASRDQNKAVQEQTSATLLAIRQQVIAAAIELDPVVLIQQVIINLHQLGPQMLLSTSFFLVNFGKTVAKKVEWAIAYECNGMRMEELRAHSERQFELISNEDRDCGYNLSIQDHQVAFERADDVTLTIRARYRSSFMDPNERDYISTSVHKFVFSKRSAEHISRSTGSLVGFSGATTEILL